MWEVWLRGKCATSRDFQDLHPTKPQPHKNETVFQLHGTAHFVAQLQAPQLCYFLLNFIPPPLWRVWRDPSPPPFFPTTPPFHLPPLIKCRFIPAFLSVQGFLSSFAHGSSCAAICVVLEFTPPFAALGVDPASPAQVEASSRRGVAMGRRTRRAAAGC
jgi:hypothetical protein